MDWYGFGLLIAALVGFLAAFVAVGLLTGWYNPAVGE